MNNIFYGDKLNSKIEALYKSIAQGVFAAKPTASWEKGTYHYETIRLMTKATCRFTLTGGGEASATPSFDVPQGFETLRDEMAQLDADNHVWYTAKCHVTPAGKFSFEFEYDHLPAFDIMPSASKWIDEFKHYPRPELQVHVQDWIDGKVESSEIIQRLERLRPARQ